MEREREREKGGEEGGEREVYVRATCGRVKSKVLLTDYAQIIYQATSPADPFHARIFPRIIRNVSQSGQKARQRELPFFSLKIAYKIRRP